MSFSQVYAYGGSDWQLTHLYALDGHQGDEWIRVELEIGPRNNDGIFAGVQFEARRGNGYAGDLALDDIAFRHGECFVIGQWGVLTIKLAKGVLCSENGLFALYSQCHGCWCPGDARRYFPEIFQTQPLFVQIFGFQCVHTCFLRTASCMYAIARYCLLGQIDHMDLYERMVKPNQTKRNKTVCLFGRIYCCVFLDSSLPVRVWKVPLSKQAVYWKGVEM